MLEFTIDGETSFYTFDIKKVFKNKREAREFARKRNIPIELDK
jgi:hypothetical protein